MLFFQHVSSQKKILTILLIVGILITTSLQAALPITLSPSTAAIVNADWMDARGKILSIDPDLIKDGEFGTGIGVMLDIEYDAPFDLSLYIKNKTNTTAQILWVVPINTVNPMQITNLSTSPQKSISMPQVLANGNSQATPALKIRIDIRIGIWKTATNRQACTIRAAQLYGDLNQAQRAFSINTSTIPKTLSLPEIEKPQIAFRYTSSTRNAPKITNITFLTDTYNGTRQ